MLSYHNVLFFSILYGIFSSKYTLTYLLIIFKRSFSTILRDDFLKNLMLLLRTTLSTFLKHKSEQNLYLIIYIYIYLCIYYIYCIPSLPYYVMSYRTVCFRIFISNRAHNDVSSNHTKLFGVTLYRTVLCCGMIYSYSTDLQQGITCTTICNCILSYHIF